MDGSGEKKPKETIPDELYYKIEERVNARRLMLHNVEDFEKMIEMKKVAS